MIKIYYVECLINKNILKVNFLVYNFRSYQKVQSVERYLGRGQRMYYF